MKSLIAFTICAALSLPVLAQQVETQKHGDLQAEAAAQARVEARSKIPIKKISQPEAQRSSSAKATALAERRKAQRLQGPRHPADQTDAIQLYQKR
jgi:hypothetical protein